MEWEVGSRISKQNFCAKKNVCCPVFFFCDICDTCDTWNIFNDIPMKISYVTIISDFFVTYQIYGRMLMLYCILTFSGVPNEDRSGSPITFRTFWFGWRPNYTDPPPLEYYVIYGWPLGNKHFQSRKKSEAFKNIFFRAVQLNSRSPH